MINGLEGIPGSGKSYEAVVFHVLEALKSGRKVITNLPLNIELFGGIDPAFPALIEVRSRPRKVLGTWDANRVDDKGQGNAFELFSLDHQPPALPAVQVFAGANQTAFVRSPPRDLVTFGGVWDYYDTWRHSDGRGALFVVDECHVCLSVAGSGQSTDPQVVEWFKLHRHFNVDVLLMTQNFRDVNQPIARLLAMLIKVRKADILGKKGSYIRKVHAGYRGAVISTDERKYQPQFFPLYKSHTQGNSVAESSATDVAPFIVKFNRFKWIWLAGTVIYGAYAFWPSSKVKPDPAYARAVNAVQSENRTTPLPVPPGQTPVISTASKPSPAASAPAPAPPPELDPEPLREKLVHIVGWAKFKGKMVYAFAVSAGGQRVFDLNQVDLLAAGYGWKPLSECMGYLTYKTTVRTVTCDPPAIGSGSNAAPVVIADGSRRSSVENPVNASKDGPVFTNQLR
ncbi:zona occludens toxin [Polaromonas sp. CG_9.5]|uniref:zonular occludens toxin domain-containing protein n=1 Tax=Polaromonas sp. CG_9.5 TaxID=3071705 RepID=UPI002DFBEB8B|nr:zona occludens toxin [Polaromonas sp. CG_9.5]